MAKWGEGDPRWIVENRPDAHNVNNWHWRESDATQWSREKLKKLLVGLDISDEDVGSCKITGIKSCDGEASVSNRKKKIIRFFEFNLKLKWKGKLKGGDIEFKGEAEIPNLSEENEADELDVNISFGKDDVESNTLKELMRTLGAVLIRDKIGIYMEALVKEYSQTLILPTKDSSNEASKSIIKNNTSSNDLKSEMGNLCVNGSKPSSGVKIETKLLKMTETFMTTVEELFLTLTVKDRIKVWSRSDMKETAKAGVGFSFFDGNVQGEYTEVVENKKITMKWRLKSWPDAHYSQAIFTFEQTVDGARLMLEQTGVPKDAVERTTEGWKRYYWHAMKMSFGYGSVIM